MNRIGVRTVNAVKTRITGAAIMCAATLAAPRLAGQELWSTYKYGFQVGALSPVGDELKTVAGTGLGVAGYLEQMWSNGWGIRGRLEYTYFGEKEVTFGVKTNMNQTGAILDVVYYSRNSSLYPFAGIGYFSRSGERRMGDLKENMDMSAQFAVALGGGWNFTNHLGLEIKYSICESSWIQASLLYRF